MKSYIQFLTTPTVDTPGTALVLHFDEKRYLIGNIHEGLQRAGVESGLKFTKVTDIFLTGKTEWKTTGGLFGLILTLADAAESAKAAIEALRQKQARKRQQVEDEQGAKTETLQKNNLNLSDISKPTLNIHGGPNLYHSVAAARRFIFRKSTPVNILEDEGGIDKWETARKPDWVDGHIQAWTMAIEPSKEDSSVETSPTSRKRSHTEYAEADFPKSLFRSHSEEKKKVDDDQAIRRHAVSEMFNSTWRIDDLEERPLSEVGENAQLFVRNPETKKLERYKPPPSDGIKPLPNINVLTRKAWPGALIDELPGSKPSQTALSYIIRNHRQRGKFMPAKAKEHKVRQGPQWAQLAAGENVESSEGKTVTPAMVLAEGKDGGGIAIVDLPSTAYVENLIKRSEWQDSKTMTGVAGILWLLGAGVAKDQRLQDFILSHKSLEHMISSPDDCSNYLAFSSAAASAIRLSQVNSSCYPVPIHNNNSSTQSTSQHSTPAIAQRGQKFQLEPSFEKQDDALVPILDTAKVLYSTPKEVLRLARDAREQIERARLAKTPSSVGLPSEDAEITCLGTGSALPSKYRNVAGTLLRVPGCGSYLLDCGENTLGQLKRVYGPETLKEILCDLKMIWISHLHADHHLGTVSVIKAWYQEVHGLGQRPTSSSTSIFDEFSDKVFTEKDRLCVAGTHQMMQWLKEYSSVEDYGYTKILPLASIARRNDSSFIQWHGKRMSFRDGSLTTRLLQTTTGLTDLAACSVSHCWDAQAVVLTFPTGLKVSYSGDCRPSKRFAEIGQDSTVLIHEATFDDELQGDAIAKRHSTTSEAIGVGLAMRAQRVILTHFSQRYQKIPVMESVEIDKVQLEDAEDEDPNVPMVDAGTSEVTNDDTIEREIMEEPVANQGTIATVPNVSNIQTPTEPEGSQATSTDTTSPEIIDTPAKPNNGLSTKPPLNMLNEDMKICVAFDYMKVKVGDIEYMEKLTPALLELYQTVDPEEDLEKDAASAELSKDVQSSKPRKGKRNNEEINRGKSKKDKGQAKKAPLTKKPERSREAPLELPSINEFQMPNIAAKEILPGQIGGNNALAVDPEKPQS